MKNQNANQFEKDEEDFDFFNKFKKPTSQSQSQQQATNFKDKLDAIKKNHFEFLDGAVEYFKINKKKILIVSFAILFPIFVGLNSVYESKVEVKNVVQVSIQKESVKMADKPIVTKNPEQTLNVDYSNVTKEQEQQVQQILQGFQDFTKQLKESNQPKQ